MAAKKKKSEIRLTKDERVLIDLVRKLWKTQRGEGQMGDDDMQRLAVVMGMCTDEDLEGQYVFNTGIDSITGKVFGESHDFDDSTCSVSPRE